MTITLDSNVLLSIFSKDSLYECSISILEKYSSHEYIINDCIYLELGVHFSHLEKLDESLNILEVTLIEEYQRNYKTIIHSWINYLKRKQFNCPYCGKTIEPVCPQCQHKVSFRQRILTDFLIASFALENSDGIITFDPTYYKGYFPQLKIFE